MDKKDLNFLREIGIEKIKQDTKLDAARISDILEKRFERLDYVRAKGFVSILEKEYGLDLSDWLQEYRTFCLENEGKTTTQTENLTLRTQQYEFVTHNVQKRKRKFFILGGVGICIILAIWGFYSFYDSKEPKNSMPQVAQLQLTQEANVIKDADKPKDEVSTTNQSGQLNDTSSREQSQNNTEQLTIKGPIEALGTPLFEGVEINENSVLQFEFKRPIWVGTIELNGKKRNANTREKYEFPLDKERLFYVAYGRFDASLGNVGERFRSNDPVFLIYTKEGGLRRLNKAEYLFINNGIIW